MSRARRWTVMGAICIVIAVLAVVWISPIRAPGDRAASDTRMKSDSTDRRTGEARKPFGAAGRQDSEAPAHSVSEIVPPFELWIDAAPMVLFDVDLPDGIAIVTLTIIDEAGVGIRDRTGWRVTGADGKGDVIVYDSRADGLRYRLPGDRGEVERIRRLELAAVLIERSADVRVIASVAYRCGRKCLASEAAYSEALRRLGLSE